MRTGCKALEMASQGPAAGSSLDELRHIAEDVRGER
jgi:hypothetical protein